VTGSQDTTTTGAALEAAPVRLSMRDVRVAFGATIALDGVDLDVRAGEIVGLLGHNGAGKSTLIKVAIGSVKPQAGSLEIDGRAQSLDAGPRARERAGIRAMHQDPALTGNLSIADNVALCGPLEREPAARRREAAAAALARLGIELSPDRPVETLSVAERQMVDLARAIAAPLRVLLLDEPTATLGKHETDRLHEILRSLAAEGTAIVYVSHRMRDVVAVCSRVVVLREGRVVMDGSTAGVSGPQLSRALSPADATVHDAHPTTPGREVLAVETPGGPVALRSGEILGLYGMAAGPQEGLLTSLFGLAAPVEAQLDGAPYRPGSPHEAIDCGVYFVSADREREGLLADMSGADNVTLPWLRSMCRAGGVSHEAIGRMYTRSRQALHIHGPGGEAPLNAFSGGNRQKHVLARWLFGPEPKVLLLVQPTQGVDVGARTDIAATLREAAAHGVAILVASSEADEISLLCDRVLIADGPSWQEVPRMPNWEERMVEVLLREHELA